MKQQPLTQAAISVQEAMQERTNMMALLVVLINKLGGEVVVTTGEIEGVDPLTAIRHSDHTELGFKVSTYKMEPPPPGKQ